MVSPFCAKERKAAFKNVSFLIGKSIPIHIIIAFCMHKVNHLSAPHRRKSHNFPIFALFAAAKVFSCEKVSGASLTDKSSLITFGKRIS